MLRYTYLAYLVHCYDVPHPCLFFSLCDVNIRGDPMCSAVMLLQTRTSDSMGNVTWFTRVY